MMLLLSFFGLGFIASGRSVAMQIEGCGQATDCGSCHSLTPDEASTIMQGIGTIKSTSLSSVRGLFEVVVESGGKQALVYMDFGKKHLIPAPIFSLATRMPIDNLMQQEAPVRQVDVASIPQEPALVLGNPQGKRILYVFTDPECPYCAKLHSELQKLAKLEPELAIRIKLFPLKMHPKAFDKSRVIMAARSVALLEKAFAGEQLAAAGAADLAKPVEDTIKLAEKLGVTSTPTVILPDGRVVVGFQDATLLQKLINEATAR